jgi:hypothetical protein
MLYISVWFALISQLLLVIIQKYIFQGSVTDFMVNRVFVAQIGFTLVAPGVFQLMLEKGVFLGLWTYISHFFILAVYSTFHILNISSYWQWGLEKTAFYLPSGRGSGLEHYFMKDMYNTFYSTHWRPGFIIMWLGFFQLVLSGNFLVFLVMYVLPAGIWLWGAMFLNPGALPTTVHEEQWKRLINRDMQETDEIIKEHTKSDKFRAPATGFALKRAFIKFGRQFSNFANFCHWVYTVINFGIHTRVVRVLAIFTLGWEMIFSSRIPTFIFTDDRRRVLRWDEEDNRQKSIFYSNMSKVSPPDNPPGAQNGSQNQPKKVSSSTRSSSMMAISPDKNTTRATPEATDKRTRLVFVDQRAHQPHVPVDGAQPKRPSLRSSDGADQLFSHLSDALTLKPQPPPKPLPLKPAALQPEDNTHPSDLPHSQPRPTRIRVKKPLPNPSDPQPQIPPKPTTIIKKIRKPADGSPHSSQPQVVRRVKKVVPQVPPTQKHE